MMDSSLKLWLGGIRTKMLKRLTTTWSIPGWYIAADEAQAIVANRLLFTPFYVAEERTYVRIGINTTTGAAGTARLGIYYWDTVAGLPGALLLDAGTVDTADVHLDQITIDQLLSPGFYFLAIVCDAAPTLTSANGLYSSPPVQGYSYNFATPDLCCLFVNAAGAQVAGGLADPATTPDGETQPAWGAFVRLRD